MKSNENGHLIISPRFKQRNIKLRKHNYRTLMNFEAADFWINPRSCFFFVLWQVSQFASLQEIWRKLTRNARCHHVAEVLVNLGFRWVNDGSKASVCVPFWKRGISVGYKKICGTSMVWIIYTCNRGLQIAGQTLNRCTKPCHPEQNGCAFFFLVSNICLKTSNFKHPIFQRYSVLVCRKDQKGT